MKNTEILTRINALLNRKVKLEQATLENGTVVEAESFEVGTPIFAIDGENKVPLEVGEYVLSDGSIIKILEIGIIGEITPIAEVTEEVEAGYKKEMADVPATLEEILTAVVDAIQPKLDDMQTQIDNLSATNTEMKATLSKTIARKPLTHNPIENKTNLSKFKNNNNINLSNTEALIMARLS